MCIAISVVAGTPIDPQHLRNAYDRHPDGFGMAWAINDSVHTFKSLTKNGTKNGLEVDGIIKLINETHLNCPRIIHFRQSTCGTTTKDNCHPFRIGKFAMIHNGHIPIKHGKKQSDTSAFAQYLRDNINPDETPLSRRLITKEILKEFIGQFNKIIFLGPDGRFYWINRDQGNWQSYEKIWYSNTSITWPVRQSTKTTPYPTTTTPYDRFDDDLESERLLRRVHGASQPSRTQTHRVPSELPFLPWAFARPLPGYVGPNTVVLPQSEQEAGQPPPAARKATSLLSKKETLNEKKADSTGAQLCLPSPATSDASDASLGSRKNDPSQKPTTAPTVLTVPLPYSPSTSPAAIPVMAHDLCKSCNCPFTTPNFALTVRWNFGGFDSDNWKCAHFCCERTRTKWEQLANTYEVQWEPAPYYNTGHPQAVS